MGQKQETNILDLDVHPEKDPNWDRSGGPGDTFPCLCLEQSGISNSVKLRSYLMVRNSTAGILHVSMQMLFLQTCHILLSSPSVHHALYLP